VADRDSTLDRALTEFPRVDKAFRLISATSSGRCRGGGRLSDVTGDTLVASRADLEQNLRLLQRSAQATRPLRRPICLSLCGFCLPNRFSIDSVKKIARGDYFNISGTFDLT